MKNLIAELLVKLAQKEEESNRHSAANFRIKTM